MLYKLKTWTVTLEVNDPEFPDKLDTPEKVARLAQQLYKDLDADQEHFSVFCLNNKHTVRAWKVIFTGSMTASLVHPRDVFRHLILNGAAGFICVHNHPSGEPNPSQQDIEITRRLELSAQTLGIEFLDHVIIGDTDKWVSLKQRGLL